MIYDNVRVLEGDCLQALGRLPELSVDLIVTSPPYADRRKGSYGGVAADKYIDWFLPRAAEMMRVLKASGHFVLNIKEHSESNGEQSTYVYELVLALREQGWKWIYEYIWHKPNPYPGKRTRKLKDGFERCLHFARSTDIRIYPDAVAQPCKPGVLKRAQTWAGTSTRKRVSKNGSGLSQQNMSRALRNMLEKGTALPSNVISIRLLTHNKNHSAVFPPELPEFFIKLMTRKNQVVLDPFAGSGTTLEVAARLGRKAIGIEMKPEYYDELTRRFA